MALRSTVSSLSKAPGADGMPAAPAPRLSRRPGMYKPPADAVDLLKEDPAEASESGTAEQPATSAAPVAKPKAARKPRTPKAVATKAVTSDVKATRALIDQVEGDMIDLKAQMQKSLAKFQPKLERLQARHAELSAALAKQLTQ